MLGEQTSIATGTNQTWPGWWDKLETPLRRPGVGTVLVRLPMLSLLAIAHFAVKFSILYKPIVGNHQPFCIILNHAKPLEPQQYQPWPNLINHYEPSLKHQLTISQPSFKHQLNHHMSLWTIPNLSHHNRPWHGWSCFRGQPSSLRGCHASIDGADATCGRPHGMRNCGNQSSSRLNCSRFGINWWF